MPISIEDGAQSEWIAEKLLVLTCRGNGTRPAVDSCLVMGTASSPDRLQDIGIGQPAGIRVRQHVRQHVRLLAARAAARTFPLDNVTVTL